MGEAEAGAEERKPLNLDDLKDAAGEMSDEEASERLQRLGDQITTSHVTSAAKALNEASPTRKAAASVAKAALKRPAITPVNHTFSLPAVDNLRALQEDWAKQHAELEQAAESVAEAYAAREDRADAQANATIEIAEAQSSLQEMQQRSIDLAVETAAATAKVAEMQQQVVESISQELDVLREQAAGQRTLIRSGFNSGVVMEWTLFVAVIAAVATVLLSVTAPDGPSGSLWLAASVLVCALGASLGIWQWRRRPGPRDDSSRR